VGLDRWKAVFRAGAGLAAASQFELPETRWMIASLLVVKPLDFDTKHTEPLQFVP
jgi:hypothetical protein